MQPPGKRLTRAEQKARTRDRLVAAARRVIARRGLGAASVDEISEHAGFSSGAFYANFDSKEDVFAAALEFHAEEFDRLLADRAGAGSPHERLAADVDWLLELDDWRVLFWLEMVAQGGRSARLRRLLSDYFAAARARIAEALEQGARESGRPLARPAAELAALVLAAEIGIFVQRLFDREAVDAELLRRLLDLVAAPDG